MKEIIGWVILGIIFLGIFIATAKATESWKITALIFGVSFGVGLLLVFAASLIGG